MWELPTRLAELTGWKRPAPTSNWLSDFDYRNLFDIVGLEVVRYEDRLLLPLEEIEEALYSGVTTMMGGGTGPAHGTVATTMTPGPWHLGRMLQAAEGLPMNFGFFGKGNTSKPAGITEQVEAGACGLKLHEDWGTTPAAIEPSHRRRPHGRAGRDPHRHAERSRASSKTTRPPSRAARSTHSTPRARAAAMRRTSSASAARERTTVLDQSDAALHRQHRRRASRHAHGLPSSRPAHSRDVAFAESRIRRETIAAEDILHDLAMTAILCKGLDGSTPQEILDLPSDFVTRIVGTELVRVRSQTVYYVLTRIKSICKVWLDRQRMAQVA